MYRGVSTKASRSGTNILTVAIRLNYCRYYSAQYHKTRGQVTQVLY